MNASQQQRVLQALVEAQSIIGGNGGVPTVPALYLDFLPPSKRSNPRDFFAYNVEFPLLASGGGADTQGFTVQSDSDFLITSLSAAVVDPTAQETARPFDALTIQIRDTGSGRNLFNRDASFAAVVGTGTLPAFLPYPKWIDRASEVSASVTNLNSTEDVLVRLTFAGFKIFDMMR